MSNMSSNFNNKVYDLFLSWNHLDHEIIEKKYRKYIISAGIKEEDYYYSDKGDTIGDINNIPASVALSSGFTIILTKNCLPSRWCLAEFVRAYKTYGISRVLPVCIDNVFSYSYKKHVRRVDDDGKNRWHLNAFCPLNYNADSEEIDPIVKETHKDIHSALTVLWSKFGTLYQNGKRTDEASFITGIRNIILEAHIQSFFNDKEIFDIKILFNDNKSLKNNGDDLYIPRTLFDIDKNRVGEDDIIEAIKQRDNVLIVAGAGSGKTELLKNIRNTIFKKVEVTGLFFECPQCSRYINSNDATIFEYLFKRIEASNKYNFTESHLKGLLQAKDITIFFDGFDEIVSPIQRDNFIKALADFCINYKNVRYVLSSRFGDFDERSLDFNNFHLVGFDNQEIYRYVDALCFKFEVDEEKKEKFYFELEKIDDEIKSNPLFLTQLLLIYKNESFLPKTKFEILEKVSSYIIQLDKKRDLYKNVGNQKLIISTVERLLPYLVFHSQYNEIKNPIDEYLLKIYPDLRGKPELDVKKEMIAYIFIQIPFLI